MIRFVDLGKQLGMDETWPREFCFYNTVTSEFVMVGGAYVWESWQQFEEYYNTDLAPHYLLERFRALCPEWVVTVVPQ